MFAMKQSVTLLCLSKYNIFVTIVIALLFLDVVVLNNDGFTYFASSFVGPVRLRVPGFDGFERRRRHTVLPAEADVR